MPSFMTAEAEAKLEEAFNQLPTVQDAITTYFSLRPFKLCKSPKSDHSVDIWAYRLTRTLAPAIAIRIGNVLHNLHSAFEYVACNAARSHTGSDDRIFFPFRKDATALQNDISNLTKRFPPTFMSAVLAIAPFAGGNDLLWHMHKMYTDDKHKKLVPLLETTSKLYLGELVVTRGSVMTIGSRSGQHLVRDHAGHMSQADHSKQPQIVEDPSGDLMVFHHDLANSAAMGHDPLEVLTATPGTVFKSDMTPYFTVSFESAFPGQDATRVLRQMCEEAKRALATL